MSTYIGTIVFGPDIDDAEAEEWVEVLAKSLPDGTTAKFERQAEMIDVEKLGKGEIGRKITVWVDKLTGEVSGRLGGIYPAGRHGAGRMLIINGNGYVVNYGSAKIEEW